MLTVAQLASNGSRVWFNRDQIDRHLVVIFAAGAVPAAAAVAMLFATAPLPALTRVIGAFLLIAVAWRRWRPHTTHLDDKAFAALGAASGFGSALAGSVGPMVAPFFLARGLLRGAYIGTEAAAAVVMYLTKLAVFGAAAVLTTTTALTGLALALALASTSGAWVGKTPSVCGRGGRAPFPVGHPPRATPSTSTLIAVIKSKSTRLTTRLES